MRSRVLRSLRKWTKWLPSVGLLAAMLLALSAGCGRESTQPTGAEATPLRLAYGKKIHYAPQIIALRKGFFAEEGLAVEDKAVQAGIQAAEALTSGSADVAVMGDSPGIIAAASDMPVKIVASYGGGERMHRLVAAPRSGIRSPRDLAGKRVAVQMGSSTHGGFLLFCERNGVDLDDMTLVPLNPSDMPEAMLAGEIDAGVGSEPWPSNIEERVEGSYEVAALSGLGNNFPLVMLVSEQFAENHPEAVVAALRATERAVTFMHEHPDEAASIIAAATGVSVERERRIMDTLEWAVRLDDATVNSLKQTADFLRHRGSIQDPPDWDRVIDRSFVAQLGGESG